MFLCILIFIFFFSVSLKDVEVKENKNLNPRHTEREQTKKHLNKYSCAEEVIVIGSLFGGYFSCFSS